VRFPLLQPLHLRGRQPAVLLAPDVEQVACLIPAFQQMSATETPLFPRIKMNTFCASENLEDFIVFRSSQRGGITAENPNSEWSSFGKADPIK
jgi:hypothetical protein